MNIVQDFYNEIGQVLVSICPDNSRKIIMKFASTAKEDVFTYQYFYYVSADRVSFLPEESIEQDLKVLFLNLKKFFIDNNLTNGLPAWLGCEVSVDLEKMKIHFDMKYTEEEVEKMFED